MKLYLINILIYLMDSKGSKLKTILLKFRSLPGFKKVYYMLVIYFQKRISTLKNLIALQRFINKNFLNSLNSRDSKHLIAKIVK